MTQIIPLAKQRRLQAHNNQIARLTAAIVRNEQQSQLFSTLRLAAILIGGLLGWGASQLISSTAMWIVFGLALIVFAVIVRQHRQLRNELRRQRIWLDIKQEQIARMTHDWQAMPPAATVPPEERHALEVDFDLIGPRSLHQLLDTTVSSAASQRLRSWLTVGRAEPDVIRTRQDLVRELTPLHYFRNQITLQARIVTGGSNWSAESLIFWLRQERDDADLTRLLGIASVLAVVNGVLFALAQAGIIGGWWQWTMAAYAVVNAVALRQTNDAFDRATYLRDALEQLQGVFGHLEQFSYQRAPQTRALCAPFIADSGLKPSAYLRRVLQIVGGIGLFMGNPFLALFLHVVFPWHILLVVLLDREKSGLAEKLPRWLDTWFELEATSALANFAYLNPHYTFPELGDETVFTAKQLGHPLLQDSEKVPHDFESGAVGGVAIVTGSNMAGKSTFLRSVGINLVLAYAGSVVDSAEFKFQPARLASCIRVSDSIADGFSYFYAEVRCLKSILDQLEAENELPLIYFIDEIFRGTNNRERLIGSRALIEAMAGQNGIGLLSTHDLELVSLSDTIPLIRNFHFREDVIDGTMVFDYLLRDGPSPTTNALRIMELAGLPIAKKIG